MKTKILLFKNGQYESRFLYTKKIKEELSLFQKKTLIEQTKTKPKKIEFEFAKSRESFSFDILLGIQGGPSSHCDSSFFEVIWVFSLSTLEVKFSRRS